MFTSWHQGGEMLWNTTMPNLLMHEKGCASNMRSEYHPLEVIFVLHWCILVILEKLGYICKKLPTVWFFPEKN